MEFPQLTKQVALVEANSCPLGVQLVNSRRTNKTSGAGDLVELAKAVQKADEFTKANAGSKLTIIVDQIRYLQSQARKVLEDARRDAALHHAACNLVKRPGTMYNLYERESGQSYLSILSPQEWGASCPHEFLGAYRLEYDHSWTPITEVEKRNEENAFIDKIYKSQLSLSDSSTSDIIGLKKHGSSSQLLAVTENANPPQES